MVDEKIIQSMISWQVGKPVRLDFTNPTEFWSSKKKMK